MIWSLLPFRDGCLNTRWREIVAPVPGFNAALDMIELRARKAEAAKAVGHPTSDSNWTARQQHIGRIEGPCPAGPTRQAKQPRSHDPM